MSCQALLRVTLRVFGSFGVFEGLVSYQALLRVINASWSKSSICIDEWQVR